MSNSPFLWKLWIETHERIDYNIFIQDDLNKDEANSFPWV